MTKAYSTDLREKVLEFLEKDNNKRKASELFGIDRSTIYRWIKKKEEAGSLAPIRREYTYRKIDYDKLKQHVEANPDAFLFEIAQHFSVTLQAIFYALKKLKITLKKRQRHTRKGVKSGEMNSLKSLNS